MAKEPGKLERITVLGGGAWGSTVADILARNGLNVLIWDIAEETAEMLTKERCPFGVPELNLHESVVITNDLEEAVAEADTLVMAVASQAVGEVSGNVARALPAGHAPFVMNVAKGIDTKTLNLLGDTIKRSLPDCPYGLLSGPCIAREVAKGVPTSFVCASEVHEHAVRVRDLISTPTLRAYTQDDLIGVELGGALKNPIAIAAGVGDGLGYGANSKAGLMTRGLAEIARLAVALGAKQTTMFGLAGLGDLAVTCFSEHSRNRTFGEALGKGRSP